MKHKSRNKWTIEQHDVGTVHLLADGQERCITHDDIGLLYVCDNEKGDRLEVAPVEVRRAHSDNDTEDT